jgi:hypothetical protein
MSSGTKAENTVNLIIEAGGDFTFNDSLEALDAKTAREAGRSIVNFALGLFAAPRRRARKAADDTPDAK